MPVGGRHITNDISILLKINQVDAEILKKSLNQSEIIFENKIDKNNYTKFEIESGKGFYVRSLVSDICKKLNIPSNKRVNQLTDDEILKIREYICLLYTSPSPRD